jgi:hypothetical protein
MLAASGPGTQSPAAAAGEASERSDREHIVVGKQGPKTASRGGEHVVD